MIFDKILLIHDIRVTILPIQITFTFTSGECMTTNRIQTVSSYLVTIFNLLLFILPIASVLSWFYIDTPFIQQWISKGILFTPVQTPAGIVYLDKVSWTPLTKTLGLASELIELLPFFISLFILKSIFKNYQNSKIFTTQNARSYKHLGWLFLAHACLAKPLSDLLLVGATTLSNPPGQRYLSFGLGTPNLESVFCGSILLVISWIMLEASKLQDEQTLTI